MSSKSLTAIWGDGSTANAANETTEEGLSRDTIFEVLSNERRRLVLHYLKHRDGRVDLRELVDHVAAWEYDTEVGKLDSSRRKRVYTALRQSHLPKLDDAGVVSYDNRRGAVELTEDAREVQVYLEYVPEDDIPWSTYYLGLSAIMGIVVMATWIGIFPFAEATGIGLAAFTVAAFAASAAVHTRYTQQNELGRAIQNEPGRAMQNEPGRANDAGGTDSGGANNGGADSAVKSDG